MTAQKAWRSLWSGRPSSNSRSGTLVSLIPSRAIGFIVMAGALLGALNLSVDDVLRPGAARVVYAMTMIGLGIVGLAILSRDHLSYRAISALIAAGNIIY